MEQVLCGPETPTSAGPFIPSVSKQTSLCFQPRFATLDCLQPTCLQTLMSANLNVCSGGFSMKAISVWFGHDIATARKHDHPVMQIDFDRASEVDPFQSTQKATPVLPRVSKNDPAPKKCVGNTRKNRGFSTHSYGTDKGSDPYGVRTRVAGVKGRSPRPLDEGAAEFSAS